MKKKLVGLLVGTLGLMLVACASQVKEAEEVESSVQEVEVTETGIQETKDIATDASENEIYEGTGMANPWVDSDKAGVLEATGFDLVAPEEASNVAYSFMPGTGMAQMNYTTGNAMWVYRIQPTETFEDISGIYCEWSYTEETKIAGMDAVEYGYASVPEGDFIDDMECTRVVNWYDAQNKVTYSLSVIGTDLNGLDTVVYAENLYNLAGNAD